MLIGDLARRAHVNVQTVRFYERRGLLAEPERTSGGYRQYPDQTPKRIRFIKRAQELGFSLTEIAELLDLEVHDDSSCHTVEERTSAKVQMVKDKIVELKALQRTLERLVDSCQSQRPTGDCPVLEMLDTDSD